ncbi:2'-5' RNA ligase family protein [Kribbella sp. NPDC059898]|uniref:2'-5' RNA ligase family protein n=1 Tax=Kribbella sp. NPDC059898 TaxID=3346995 RepID=UPI0036510A9F
MRPFFTSVPAARWENQSGRLHVYVMPPEPVLQLADDFHAVMEPFGDLVSVQPRRWLHLTVQMLHQHLDDTGPGQLAAIGSALRSRLAGLDPFELTAGPAVVGVHGVTLWIPPPTPEARDGYGELVYRVREAATDVFGRDVLPAGTAGAQPRPVPHIGLGYGLAAGDPDPLIRAVKDTWRAPVRFTVDQVVLVAVDQHPAAGTFTWLPLDKIALTN